MHGAGQENYGFPIQSDIAYHIEMIFDRLRNRCHRPSIVPSAVRGLSNNVQFRRFFAIRQCIWPLPDSPCCAGWYAQFWRVHL